MLTSWLLIFAALGLGFLVMVAGISSSKDSPLPGVIGVAFFFAMIYVAIRLYEYILINSLVYNVL